MKSDNYITIQGWMVKDLGLKNTEAMAYALIYGFSQSGQGKFTGSLKYLQEWLGVSKNTASRVLKSLEERGHIQRHVLVVNGVTFNHYSAVERGSKNLTPPPKIDPGGVPKIDPGGVPKIDPYNTILDNTNRDIDSSSVAAATRTTTTPLLFKGQIWSLNDLSDAAADRVVEQAIRYGLNPERVDDFMQGLEARGNQLTVRSKGPIPGLKDIVEAYNSRT